MPQAEPNPSLSTEAQKVSPETAIPMEPIQAAGFQAKAGNSEPRPPERREWLIPALGAALAALITILLYLPTLRYKLVWDDTIFLSDIPLYRQAGAWLPTLFRPFVLSPNYFRPFALLTFMVELRLVGQNPVLFHLDNILLHGLNTSLVTLLAGRLVGWGFSNTGEPQTPWRKYLPGLAGLLYGLHPALIEGVAFVSSRFDLLMTTCLLLALLVDRSKRRNWSRLALVGTAFLFAALSKEMAMAFVLALPAWHLALESRLGALSLHAVLSTLRRNWVAYLGTLIGGLTYLIIRYLSLGYVYVLGTGASIPGGDFGQHLLLIFKSLGSYLILVVWPFTSLAPIHFSILPVSSADVSAWLGLLVVLLGMCGLLLAIFRRSSLTAQFPAWLALAGLLALLPVSNLLLLELSGGAYIAERFLLFPMIFFALAAAAGLSRLQIPARNRLKTGLGVTVAVWLVACLASVQIILPGWQDSFSLWSWAANRAPQSSVPPTNLSLEMTNHGLPEQGLSYAQAAIQLDSKNGDAWDNEGLALFNLQKYSDAQAAFQSAIQLQPGNSLYWNNLAGALREQNQLAEAEKTLLDHAIKLDPNLPAAHLNLGIVYLKADRPDLASQQLIIAQQLLPAGQFDQSLLLKCQEPDRWLRLGDLLMANSDFQGAARAYNQAASFGAALNDAAAGLSSALLNLKDYANASQVLNQAVQQYPQDARLYNNLGLLASAQGNLDQARQYLQKAIELAPNWDVPQKNLAALPK